jgi:hypothetical protein
MPINNNTVFDYGLYETFRVGIRQSQEELIKWYINKLNLDIPKPKKSYTEQDYE